MKGKKRREPLSLSEVDELQASAVYSLSCSGREKK